MGYLFLAAALTAGLAKGYCGKRMGNYAANTTAASFLNLLRMAFCVLFGGAFLLLVGDGAYAVPSARVLWIAALSGVFTSFFVVSWLISVKKSAYMMIDVFLMLGTVVPMTLGRILFSEAITWGRLLGFAVLLASAFIMCSYNNTIKPKLTFSALVLLVLCGLANGLVDFSQKLFVKTAPNVPVSVFNFYTYVFAALTLLAVYFVLSRKEKPRFESPAPKLWYLYVAVMAVALISYSFFKTRAAVYLDSAVLYPLSQSLALVLNSLMVAIFFGERLNAKAVVGISLSFVGLLIMNFLSP